MPSRLGAGKLGLLPRLKARPGGPRGKLAQSASRLEAGQAAQLAASGSFREGFSALLGRRGSSWSRLRAREKPRRWAILAPKSDARAGSPGNVAQHPARPRHVACALAAPSLRPSTQPPPITGVLFPCLPLVC